MGFFDKVLNSIKMGDEDEDYLDDDEYMDDDEEYDAPSFRKSKSIRTATMDDNDDYSGKPTIGTRPTSGTSAPVKNGKNRLMANGMEVCVIKPTSADDAKEIADTLMDKRTVILNLEGVDFDVSQRVIDFAYGSAYTIGGNFLSISNHIFVITPHNVDVSGDYHEILSGALDVPSLNNRF